jgi:hypothetical protein
MSWDPDMLKPNENYKEIPIPGRWWFPSALRLFKVGITDNTLDGEYLKLL